MAYSPGHLLNQTRHGGQVGAKSWLTSRPRHILKRPCFLRGLRGHRRGPVSTAVAGGVGRVLTQHHYELCTIISF